ncbi:MAG: sigma-54 dependent transcriptional regulator [Planctomycetota bacterium]|nr:sigma-54 dependent transcriptional regulator [Planctomycetota bacterium]
MARILIVDDAEENLLLYQLYLKGDEFEVSTASGGKQALDAVSNEEFDLVLLDVVMPEMDGIEVCRRLKASPRTASIPVIFFTGRLKDSADRQVAYDAGAVDYLTKPVEKQELVARIRVMLRFRQERANLEAENAELAEAVRKIKSVSLGASEELEDRRALLNARTGGEGATIILDGDTVVTGLSDTAVAIFPELKMGDRIDTLESGPLGSLAECLGEAAAGTQRVIEGAGGRTLRISVDEMQGTGFTVLRARDISEEERIKQRIADRCPEDLPALVERIASEQRGTYSISKFIGESPVLRELIMKVDKLRQGRCTTLIVGESGSGKELIASALHFDGPFGSRPFTPLHCGAISPELIESELFGYERGAFTGAASSKEGLFAACDGGTIFLDEIAETSMDLQVKLLRVLQTGEVRPVGATRPRHVDVRIIAATNRNLAQMVERGEFREDLYYRLDVVTLHLPPLRQRKEDVPLLAHHFIKRFNDTYGRRDEPVADVTQGAMRALCDYHWPGNVRELENVLEGAFALGIGATIGLEDLPRRVREYQPSSMSQSPGRASVVPEASQGLVPGASAQSLRDQKRDYERQMFLDKLAECGWNKVEACKELRMAKSTFYRKLKELGIADHKDGGTRPQDG